VVFGLEGLLNRIVVRADVMAGKPVIRNTGITVDLIFGASWQGHEARGNRGRL